jgi:hypothetical protein
MSMKNSNDTIGNRFRDLPVCRAVPQPLRHRVHPNYSVIVIIIIIIIIIYLLQLSCHSVAAVLTPVQTQKKKNKYT